MAEVVVDRRRNHVGVVDEQPPNRVELRPSLGG
jgi:hypothetical protein